jgi:steroid delta-isomerase-like uncharacterized protein
VSHDANEALVRRFYLDLWNQWNLAVADEILAPDLRFRGTLGATDIGIGTFKRYFEQAREAFPDLRSDIHELIVAYDAVVARVTWSGTHAGQFLGIPATGRSWSYEAAAIFHLAAGKIQDAWTVGDTQELWRALGIVPPGRVLGAAPRR